MLTAARIVTDKALKVTLNITLQPRHVFPATRTTHKWAFICSEATDREPTPRIGTPGQNRARGVWNVTVKSGNDQFPFTVGDECRSDSSSVGEGLAELIFEKF